MTRALLCPLLMAIVYLFALIVIPANVYGATDGHWMPHGLVWLVTPALALGFADCVRRADRVIRQNRSKT